MEKNLQKKDFTGKIIYVGLDVHLKTWHATIVFGEVINRKSFPSSSEELYKYLTRTYPVANFKLAYEAGYTGFKAYEQLSDLGAEVLVVHPPDVPTTDKETRQKTDPIDSKKIALSLQAGMLKSIYIPSKQQQNDRSLLRRRRSIVKDCTRVKNRIKSFCAFMGIDLAEQFKDDDSHWSNKFISWLESLELEYPSGSTTLKSHLRELRFLREELLLITREIRALSKTDKYDKYYRLLVSCPGIALITGMHLLTEIGDISRFNSLDNFLSFIGIVPSEHSSGSTKKVGHMNQRHNQCLRPMMIEAAWVARRYDPSLAACYNDALHRMKSQKAIIKVARKLISKIFYIWRHEEKYVLGVA